MENARCRLCVMDDFAVVIPSRSRPFTARACALLFHNPFVCVAESEIDEYRSRNVDNLISHPDAVNGIGQMRKWILDNFEHNVVVMVDDDVTGMWVNTGEFGRMVTDSKVITSVLVNTANVASDLGAHVFGFSQSWDVRKYNALHPFSLCTWFGGVIGFVGRSKDVRYSDRCLRVDIDYCLQSLVTHRVVWQDSRYAFVQNRASATGGNSINRSRERDVAEIKYLLQKWGRYLSISLTKGREIRLLLNVRRARSIKWLG